MNQLNCSLLLLQIGLYTWTQKKLQRASVGTPQPQLASESCGVAAPSWAPGQDVSHASRIWTNQMEVWIWNLDISYRQLGSWRSAAWLGMCLFLAMPLPGVGQNKLKKKPCLSKTMVALLKLTMEWNGWFEWVVPNNSAQTELCRILACGRGQTWNAQKWICNQDSDSAYTEPQTSGPQICRQLPPSLRTMCLPQGRWGATGNGQRATGTNRWMRKPQEIPLQGAIQLAETWWTSAVPGFSEAPRWKCQRQTQRQTRPS